MATFAFDEGSSTVWWRTICAFLMRVRKSAIGSLTGIASFLAFTSLPCECREAGLPRRVAESRSGTGR